LSRGNFGNGQGFPTDRTSAAVAAGLRLKWERFLFREQPRRYAAKVRSNSGNSRSGAAVSDKGGMTNRRPIALAALAVTGVLVGGCGMLGGLGGGRADSRAKAVPLQLEDAPAAPSDNYFAAADAPQKINLFGEFDDETPEPARPPGASGFAQLTYVDEGYDSDVTVDATGTWLAFASTRHQDRPDIYRQRIGSQSVTQLTADPADDAFPSFSRDGQKVAFASNRAGSWDIYVMDADGKNVTQITSGPTQDLHPSFSPDGRRIVFSRFGGRSGRWELWLADVEGGPRKMIGFGLFPTWSPDTSRDIIAYQRARQRGTRWFSLWCIELRDDEPLAPTEVAVSTNAAIVAPCWSPDGTELAFATVIEPVSEGQAGQQDVWTVRADGTDRRRLTDGIGTNATPWWAADGRVYFISDRGGTECVWSVAARGTNHSTAALPTD
jgi:TolB protein